MYGRICDFAQFELMKTAQGGHAVVSAVQLCEGWGMTNTEPKLPYDLTYKIRSRGGNGTNAVWEWVLTRSDQALPLKKGTVNGTERRAQMDAEAAMGKYKAAQAGKA